MWYCVSQISIRFGSGALEAPLGKTYHSARSIGAASKIETRDVDTSIGSLVGRSRRSRGTPGPGGLGRGAAGHGGGPSDGDRRLDGSGGRSRNRTRVDGRQCCCGRCQGTAQGGLLYARHFERMDVRAFEISQTLLGKMSAIDHRSEICRKDSGGFGHSPEVNEIKMPAVVTSCRTGNPHSISKGCVLLFKCQGM